MEYVGGLMLKNPWRVGIVMEFVSTTLRKWIENDVKMKDIKNQISIGKQIASGMNFLHYLNPHILVNGTFYLKAHFRIIIFIYYLA